MHCLAQSWREGNDGVAEFMLQKIMGESCVSTVRTLDIEPRRGGKFIMKLHVIHQTLSMTPRQ